MNISNPGVADGAVTTAKLADGAVTTAKIAAGAVGTTEIGADAVTAVAIAAGVVSPPKMASVGLGITGEVWNNETASRAFGSGYQAPAGYPIAVIVEFKSTAINDEVYLIASADGVTYNFVLGRTLCRLANEFKVVGGIVPKGWYYKAVVVAGAPTLTAYNELR